MSKTGAIFIATSNVDDSLFISILNILLDAGWSINRNGWISFMVDGTYDWQSEKLDMLPGVMEKMKISVANGNATLIDLANEELGAGIGLSFSSPESIFISLIDSPKMISSVGIPDFTWYLEKLSGVFDIISYSRVECVYD